MMATASPYLNNLLHAVAISRNVQRSMNHESSHPDVFCKKSVLKNFPKFTGKYLYQSLFFNAVAGLSLQLILKKALLLVLSCELCKFFMNIYLHRTPPWLLLEPHDSSNFFFLVTTCKAAFTLQTLRLLRFSMVKKRKSNFLHLSARL